MIPRISVITPSFNQGQFLEQTICSVLDQGYPNLESIVIDGGSTDNSVDIIRKYERHLTYWVSEKDRGQCDAINKGLRCATGEVWAYLNSDDCYLPGTFDAVATALAEGPGVQWVTGHARYVDENGKPLETLIPTPFSSVRETLVRWEGPPRAVAIQVSNFMRRGILERFGLFDETLHYSMDFEFGLRLLVEGITPVILPQAPRRSSAALPKQDRVAGPQRRVPRRGL